MPCSTPPDATALNPVFRASVFVITRDDRVVILPVSGIQSPGDAVYNRDYQGEHSRRLIVLDIQKLLRSGANPACAGPLTAQGSEGTIQKILGPNNGASDCPSVAGVLNLDSDENFASHGGPHFIAVDHSV